MPYLPIHKINEIAVIKTLDINIYIRYRTVNLKSYVLVVKIVACCSHCFRKDMKIVDLGTLHSYIYIYITFLFLPQH